MITISYLEFIRYRTITELGYGKYLSVTKSDSPIVGRITYGFYSRNHLKAIDTTSTTHNYILGYRPHSHKRCLYYELNPSIFGGRRTATDHLLGLCSI